MNICVVVPTIRPDRLSQWISRWEPILDKHKATLIVIHDGENQYLHVDYYGKSLTGGYITHAKDLTCGDSDLFCQFCSSCKNLGLYLVARDFPGMDVIVVLDDDCYPMPDDPTSDPIQEHLDTLAQKVPISWLEVANFPTRGLPYCVQNEAEVVFSHGVWANVPDIDAPRTLVDQPTGEASYFRGPVPKGIYFACSGMNVAFKTKILPWVYWAPVGKFEGAKRFDDIWMGIHLVRNMCLPEHEKHAIYTGGSMIWHDRASNVWNNLEQEALGLAINETYWKSYSTQERFASFFESYAAKRYRWRNLIKECLEKRPY